MSRWFRTPPPRGSRPLLAAALLCFAVGLVELARSSSYPRHSDAAWFNSRPTVVLVVWMTAAVLTLLWLVVRVPSRGDVHAVRLLAVAATAACFWLIASFMAVDLASAPLVVVSFGGVAVALVLTTIRANSLRAIPAMVVGSWLTVGVLAAYLLVRFELAPPTTVPSCADPRSCIGVETGTSDVVWLVLSFVVVSIVTSAMQWLSLVVTANLRWSYGRPTPRPARPE